MSEPIKQALEPEPIKRLCTGHSSRTGKPCRLPPVRGATVCHKHGGRAPQVKRAAERRLLEADLRELFGKVSPDPTPVDDPLRAYADLAGRVLGWMRLMDSLLDDLATVDVTTASQGEQARAIVQLYERALDRSNTVLSSYARLRIDERLAAITDKQADSVIRVIDAVIASFNPSAEQIVAARKVAATHLRLIGAEA